METHESLKRPLIGDRYELSTEIGRGASGTVWEAWDRHSSRLVAVKVFHASVLASGLGRRRFLREAELASTLGHPCCVDVLGHGEDDQGRAYVVMERLFGTTLAARLRERETLPQLEAIGLIAQVLDAVGAAHAVRIVHRDLKPANVMLIDAEGQRDAVKVCDFGLAKVIDFDTLSREHGDEEDVDLSSLSTELGDICGTPEYMAPEQARGEIIDGRADLYSAAVILYHALVGRPPFKSRSPLAVISMHLSAPPPRPSALRPDLDIYPPLESLILRALSKDRAERPSAAAVFRADLLQIGRDYARRNRSVRGSVPVDGRSQATLTDGASGSARRWRAPAVAVGLSALAAMAAIHVGRQVVSHAARSAPAAGVGEPSAPRDSPAPRSSPSVSGPAIPPTSARQEAAPAVRRAVRHPRAEPPPGEVAPVSSLAAAEERLGAGRIAEACALGQVAVEAQPRSAAAWQFVGRCRMRLGERDRASAAFRRYLELAPGASDAPFVRAILEEGP
jgi:serine/threonine-protein kinase